jgi:hypothetical protein
LRFVGVLEKEKDRWKMALWNTSCLLLLLLLLKPVAGADSPSQGSFDKILFDLCSLRFGFVDEIYSPNYHNHDSIDITCVMFER